ncbi:hypothetical protein DDR33_18005 [Pararcticibacter amylolyticus]|uniref:Non-reducing end beta-L-arabinofuranosidase-like GH127 middle domain-containing protein n=2 Tax=Pararcticibacter amylolyticus TaxID=2173175 RepID=A0A2U2PCU2_9SPHI|nr:hypothetical protein DDR33_18005 [Pararcticibacter amylolyticus]
MPVWCKNATIKLNGREWQKAEGGKIVEIKRLWCSGDVVELTLPMHTFFNKWAENSRSVERGPLVYVLKIGEQHKLVKNPGYPENYGGESFYEVRPTTPWNYGLIESDKQDLDKQFQFQAGSQTSLYPWNLENAPVSIKTKGRRIPSWQIYNDMAGPLPFSPTYRIEADAREEEITLIPYGCSTLRIAQFPVLQK